MGIIIRNDDVCGNTDLKKLKAMYDVIRELVPTAEIWSVYNFICGEKGINGAVYKDLPLRSHHENYFYENSTKVCMPDPSFNYGRIVSHGLLHLDHSKLNTDAQEMSIVTSCSLLNTKTFVPPFSEYDARTVRACKNFGIRLITKEDGWKSLEKEEFDPKHNLWFFHSWRYSPESLRERFKKLEVQVV